MTNTLLTARMALDELICTVADKLGDDAWRDLARGLADRQADTAGLLDRLSVRRLSETVLPLAEHWPDQMRAEARAAIERVIAALRDDSEDRAASVKAAWGVAERELDESATVSPLLWAALAAAAWAAEPVGATVGGPTESARWAVKAAAVVGTEAAWRAERQRITEELSKAG